MKDRNATLVGVAAHRIGSLRVGRRAVPGQGRLVDGLGRLARWIGGDRAVDSPWPGVRFETDLTDRIQRQMWAGAYEPHVRECFSVILEPGDVYFDVGAHIGFHAVFAALRVGSEGRVIAFEADPTVHKSLSRNLSQFPFAQAINAAVWHCTGSLTFERSGYKEESGWGSVSVVRDTGTGEHVTVQSISLDDFLVDSRLGRWGAMKLDAEGSELAVLKGAQRGLEMFRPILIMEINSILIVQSGASPSELADFLLQRGYSLYRIEYRRLQPWHRENHPELCDVLCLPNERSAEVIQRLAKRGFPVRLLEDRKSAL